MTPPITVPVLQYNGCFFALTEEDKPHLPADASDDSNAITYLTSNARQQDSIFTEAVQLLESMSSSPSCNRVAATRLVTSCQDLGGKGNADPDTNEILDRIRSIYAARLAICELDGAGAVVPQSCLPVTIPSPEPAKSRFRFLRKFRSTDCDEEVVSKSQLGQCLGALESRPQWWTSYSNNRQNAMIICQASRIEVEKEELLDLHQSILKSSVKLDEGLQETLRKASVTSTQHQAFLQTVQGLQNTLVLDLEKNASLFRGLFGRFLHDIEAGFDTVATIVASALSKVQMESLFLSKNIHNMSSQVDALQQVLRATHEDTVAHSQQALQVHQENTLAVNELALDLHYALESLAETDIAKLSQQMQNVDVALEWLTSRLILVLEQESKMEERLGAMDASIKQSQTMADQLQKAHRLQADSLVTQQQAAESIRLNMQVSQALLDRATAAAANLQMIIDDAAIKYKQTPGLHQVGLSIWTVCLVLLIFIGAQNFKVAISLLFFIFGHLIATTIFPFFKVYGASGIPI
ncbi:uncharacterized protein N7482_004174 [Penicillium canariense]|uniref:Nuclear membrane fusion protein Kar5 n=1 Tax=Penicillium canariense TaxID=189055 RepID=A0A9W9LQ08_9EURO|nr:uncharacterized protein N7482_004174 [Penicillium canariense]KAJ5168580.1 hypothetical protein N7482_004174 [Penicillium canariense]